MDAVVKDIYTEDFLRSRVNNVHLIGTGPWLLYRHVGCIVHFIEIRVPPTDSPGTIAHSLEDEFMTALDWIGKKLLTTSEALEMGEASIRIRHCTS